jgi:hypothetical protein
MTDLYFYRETTDTKGSGSSSWAGASPIQQPVFDPPTSEDYNTGETPALEFQLDDLFRDSADKIDGTQLAGARRDPADAGAATRDDGGLPQLDTACRRGVGGGSIGGGGGAVNQRGTRPVWIGYSRGRDRRGVVPSGSATPQATTGGGRPIGLRCSLSDTHYVKTSNRSCNICNRPLTPVTSTHICNGSCLAPVTDKRARTTPGLASTTSVTNVDFW